MTPFSFLSAKDPNVVAKVDYDFIPEATHYLPLAVPEECAVPLNDFIGTL